MSDQTIAKTSDVEYASLAFYHKISYLRSDTWTPSKRSRTTPLFRPRTIFVFSGDCSKTWISTYSTGQ